jgi:hypothetical protein
MRYLDRVLIGLLLMGASGFVLWYGSPLRAAPSEPDPLYAHGFVALFALGFVIGSMGLLGADKDYPALLSSFVLYFLIGALLAVFFYVRREGVGPHTLEDADTAAFWAHWVRFMAEWPLELVKMAGLLGY